MTASLCPDRQRWQAHLQGNLPAAEQAELVAHLDGCTVCQRLLETLASGGDADLRLARHLAEEPGLRNFLRKLADLPPAEPTAPHAADGDVSLDFLSPPRDKA